MKKINKSLLTVGAFACLSACYSVSNAASLNLNLKKSDNSGYANAIVTYKSPSASYFSLLGYTDSNGSLVTTSQTLHEVGEYVLEIYADHSLITDTFEVNTLEDVVNLNKASIGKYIKYTNSNNEPYVGESFSVRNTNNWSAIELTSDANGIATFETFENANFYLEVSKNNQNFSRVFGANEGDTMFLHTVAANIHWPHSLSHSGYNGANYDLTGNSPVKTIEVLPSLVKMKFTSESNSGPVTNDFSLNIPYDANNKNFDYTPVQFRVHKADGTLASGEFPLTYNLLNEAENSITSNNNGTAMVVLEGNATTRRITGRAYKLGKHQNDLSNGLTVASKSNVLDFKLSSLTFNTLASGDAKTINYRLPATSGYYTFTSGETNTPLELELFPTTYNFQAEYNGTISTNYAFDLGATPRSHDYTLNKVTVRYHDANSNPLAGGRISRIASSAVNLGTTDASGEIVYYRFVTDTYNEPLRLNDAGRGFNINQQYALLTEGQDHIEIFVNPNVTAPVPVSDLLTLNANVNVYPNPATDFIQVKMDAAQGEVYIYNTVGQLVYNNANVANNETISVSSLSTGVYNVVIVSNDKKETVRIVKN